MRIDGEHRVVPESELEQAILRELIAGKLQGKIKPIGLNGDREVQILLSASEIDADGYMRGTVLLLGDHDGSLLTSPSLACRAFVRAPGYLGPNPAVVWEPSGFEGWPRPLEAADFQ